MNSITNLLDLEDTDIEITDIQIQGQTKTLTLSTPPVSHFCPSCGFRMYSRGIKKRTINHPILQDNYSLVLILKQRRWRCTNPECLYDTSESFKFVNRQRRTTNATDMLIVDAYRNLLETSVSIAKKFHVSDSHAHDVFNRYVKLDRLTLTDAISIDEVFLDMDEHCKYALVIQDFHTGDPIDLLRSRRSNVTEPYFTSIPTEERFAVKYLIDYKLKEFRDLKELYLQFNARNGGNPSQAQIELEELIEAYRKSRHEIFREFASLLEKYKSSIINSFIMVEKIGNGRIYDSRLSNGPIESINRKIKDLKRLGRGFRNFEHFRNRFLYATRSVPVLNDITNYNPVLYLEEDDF